MSTSYRGCLAKQNLSQQRIRHFKILQSIYFVYEVGVIRSYSNRTYKIKFYEICFPVEIWNRNQGTRPTTSGNRLFRSQYDSVVVTLSLSAAAVVFFINLNYFLLMLVIAARSGPHPILSHSYCCWFAGKQRDWTEIQGLVGEGSCWRSSPGVQWGSSK